jgi:SulP family sulfate permease
MSFKWQEFLPAIYVRLKEPYNFSTFKKDLVAGITVAFVALPISIAFAIASGAEPIQGLITAILAGFLTSALGGGHVQIGGPAAALIVVSYSILQKSGFQGLYLSTLFASFLLVLLGICKLGSWIKYIPLPLITGCTSGIAISIFALQLGDLLGLSLNVSPTDFLTACSSYFSAIHTVHLPTLILGLGSLAVIFLLQKFLPKVPWGITVIILGTWIAYELNLSVETIESKFGHFPKTFPPPTCPSFDLDFSAWKEIFSNGATIAFLVGVESLISAVIGERLLKKDKPRSNSELIAQGIANCVCAFFGGIPASGSIPRTAVNVETGGKTPIAGIVHATMLTLILFFGFSIVSQVPLTVLAAILIVICWKMFDCTLFHQILKAPTADRIVLVIAFLLAVFVGIKVSILTGITLATFLFMRELSKTSKAALTDAKLIQDKEIKIYEIRGPFFFGNEEILKKLSRSKVCILQMQYVTLIDVSGMFALQQFCEKCEKMGTYVLLSHLQPHVKENLFHFGMIPLLKEKRIFQDLASALDSAKTLVKS